MARSPGRNGQRAASEPGPNGDGLPAKARRTAEEVDRLLLDAARKAFAERGYSGTSTREICDAAGVSEALLFRHFGTKADLFDAAVLEPFHMFVGRFMCGTPVHATGSPASGKIASAPRCVSTCSM